MIPHEVFEELKTANTNIVKDNMLMTSELIKVMNLLELNNIKAISFKGPVLSQMAYGNIALRQFVDLDILVEEKSLEKVSSILLENNYEEEYKLQNYQKENLKKLST